MIMKPIDKVIKVKLPEGIENGELIHIDVGNNVLIVLYKSLNNDTVHPLFVLNGWGDRVMEVKNLQEIIENLT